MSHYFQNLSKFKMFGHISVLFLIMFLGNLLTSLPLDFILSYIELPATWIYIAIRSTSSTILSYIAFKIYTEKVLHANMKDFRIGKLFLKREDILYGILLPLFVIIIFINLGTPFFNHDMLLNTKLEIILIAFFFALHAGILEEILFRGFIMKILETKWNKYIAIILPSILFSLVHIPSLADFNFISVSLLICGGTLVGVMFSLVTYKNSSVWGSAFIHIFWNFIMISDILWIYHGTNPDSLAIVSIVLPSDNPLLTGAGFGIEVSIVAIIGYIIICILSLIKIRNKNIKNVENTEYIK